MNNIALLEENGSSMMVEAVSQQPQQPQAYLSHNPEPQAVAGMPRLFVGQVPTDKTEHDLYPLFSSFGTVEKITTVKGPEGKSRGCAMVQFKSWSEAEKAMESLNGTSPLEGGKGRPLVVHFANPRRTANSQTTEAAIAPRKLFVGQIPKTAGERELVEIFSPFGDVDSVNILKSKGLHAGCAFVQYKKWASCEAAIQALHEQMVMPGCEHPLVVKFADAKKREDVKRGQELFDVKKQMLAMGMMNMGMNGLMASPAMMSTMMGGDMASIGLSMPMGLPGMGSLSGAVNALGGTSHLPLGLGNGKVDSIHTLDGSSRESLLAEGMDGGTHLHTSLSLGDGLHGNGLASIPSGVAGNGLVPGLNGGHPMMAGVAPDNPMGLINGGMGMPHLVVGPQRGKVGRGVTDPSAYAHKLFIGQIPFEANEQDLWGLFAAAGDILELAILRSQGRSKGCAFLTYATRTQALTAINAFNGRPAGPNKKLVVKFADQK